MISAGDEGEGRRQPLGDKNEDGDHGVPFYYSVAIRYPRHWHGWETRRLRRNLTEKER
jgi:hypothetical protein